jgi:hypothetical protein
VFTSVSLTQLDIKGYRRPFVNQYQSILLVSVLVLVFTLHALDYKSHTDSPHPKRFDEATKSS